VVAPSNQAIKPSEFNGMDEWIASLTKEQFDALVRNEQEPRYRTALVQSRLAARLGGTTERIRIPTTKPVEHVENPYRIYDVVARGVYVELKFGGDALYHDQLEKEIELIRSGLNVQYYLIDDPVRRFLTPKADLRNLGHLKIPYTHLTWEEFLDWI
jgi:hypothetical protein